MKVMQMKRLLAFGTLCVGLLCPTLSFAQAAGVPAAQPTMAPVVQAETAESLLQRVDKQNAAFSDAFFHFKMVVKSSAGATEREVEFTTKWAASTASSTSSMLASPTARKPTCTAPTSR